MPTITINWNFKSYRATVTPSTLLSDVLKEACQHFQLGSDPSNYTLVNRNGNLVDLTLPFRFTNLAQGANLDIKTQSTNTIQNVNIRINITAKDTNSTITEKFPNSISFNDVLNTVKDKSGLSAISNDRFSVQVMMKTIEYDQFDKPLASIGLSDGNHAIRIRVKPENQAPPVHSVQTLNPKKVVVEEKDATTVEKEVSPVEKKEIPPAPSVTEPGTEDIEMTTADEPEASIDEPAKSTDISYVHGKSNIKEHDDSSYEMNMEQARTYQKILSKRAADQPMLTKALREKLEAEERERKEQIKKSIYKGECTIRIKFPDNKVIQIKIDNRKSLKDLADVLIDDVLKPEVIPSKYTRGGDLFFELYIALPYTKILGKGIDLEKKIDDCEFGNRISLLFRYEQEYMRTISTGYILDHLLEKTEEPAEPEPAPEQPSIPAAASTTDNTSATKRAKFKQVPAWMKLSKK